MRPWKHLFPDVMPSVPSMAEPMAEHHIRRATQDFCRRTRAWREKLDAAITRDGERCYDLEFPPMAELVRIEGATLGAEALGLAHIGGFGCSRFVATPDGKALNLSFTPAAGLHLVIDASLMPSNDAVGLEASLFDRYAEVIAEGAIARLTGDGERALRFEARCDVIKTALWRGLAATRPRTVPNYF